MENEFRKKLSLKIKLERVKRDWSQEELAEYSDLNLNTISKIERNIISPTIDTVAKIAKAFKMEFSDLTNISDL